MDDIRIITWGTRQHGHKCIQAILQTVESYIVKARHHIFYITNIITLTDEISTLRNCIAYYAVRQHDKM